MKGACRSGLALGALAVAPACSLLSLEVGEPLDAGAIAAFEPGHTRRAEVLEVLGPPSALGTNGEGLAFLYEHVALDEEQLGLNLDALGALLGASWLGVFKVALGDSGAGRTGALILFDREGRVTSAELGDWDEKFGRGGSVQLFFSVEAVVDADALRQTPEYLSWGLRLLDPLPQMLNAQHVPDVELRGTPRDMGQRTLEQRAGVRAR